MAELLRFNGVTYADLPPKTVLKSARDAKLRDALVIGFKPDNTFFFACGIADGAHTLYLLERARDEVMERLRAQCPTSS